MRLSPLFATGLLIASGLAAAPFARAAEAPYQVVIWADAKYDAAGALTALEFPKAEDYSEPLLGNLRNRIAARPATPKLDGDVPATYETGVRVTLTITPETGTVAVDEITDMPLALRMPQARFTEDMSAAPSTWDGRVMAGCTVSVKGRCGPVEILPESSGAPEEARRYAKMSLAGWRFQPQKVGGKPVEGKVVAPIVIERTGMSRPTLRGREY